MTGSSASRARCRTDRAACTSSVFCAGREVDADELPACKLLRPRGRCALADARGGHFGAVHLELERRAGGPFTRTTVCAIGSVSPSFEVDEAELVVRQLGQAAPRAAACAGGAGAARSAGWSSTSCARVLARTGANAGSAAAAASGRGLRLADDARRRRLRRRPAPRASPRRELALQDPRRSRRRRPRPSRAGPSTLVRAPSGVAAGDGEVAAMQLAVLEVDERLPASRRGCAMHRELGARGQRIGSTLSTWVRGRCRRSCTCPRRR